MKDVARIEVESQGFWLINLFGKRRYMVGTIKVIDLVDQHLIILEKKE